MTDTPSTTPYTEPLTKEEFLVLFSIDYLGYDTIEDAAKSSNIDIEYCTMIFLKLEDIGFITIKRDGKIMQTAAATTLGKEALQEDQYLDFVPE
jgi:DNA-binding MarR family transcriptional regulator